MVVYQRLYRISTEVETNQFTRHVKLGDVRKVGGGPLITASEEDELVSMHLVTSLQLYQ